MVRGNQMCTASAAASARIETARKGSSYDCRATAPPKDTTVGSVARNPLSIGPMRNPEMLAMLTHARRRARHASLPLWSVMTADATVVMAEANKPVKNRSA